MAEITSAVPWPWISEPRSLADALAAVDETFLRALRELDMPDGHFKNYLMATANAELNRRAGVAYSWPVLDLPARESTAAQRYLSSAGAVVANQRWTWPEEEQSAGDLRLLVLYLFGLEVAKAEVAEAQTAEPASEPVSDPVAVAKLERLEAHAASVEASIIAIRDGLADSVTFASKISEEQMRDAAETYLDLRQAIRALKNELKADIRNGDEARAFEVRRWGGKAH